jgi:hypothetical protein
VDIETAAVIWIQKYAQLWRIRHAAVNIKKYWTT